MLSSQPIGIPTARTAALAALFLALGACPPPTDPPLPPTDAPADVSSETDGGSELPATQCNEASECVALWGVANIPECKQAACNDGNCELVDAAEGTECVPTGPCALTATCQAGTCTASTSVACDDDNECTTDDCDPENGCVHTFNQKPCDDGTICTTGDRCFQGSCQGDELSCDDNNLCTDDVCDPGVGCVNTPNEDECTDGDACTNGDTCVTGTCVPGPPLDCDDGQVCTTEACDTEDGCVFTILDGPCDDGDLCTDETFCVEGVCTPNIVTTCDDGNACTTDKCDPIQGCTYTNNFAPCEDGDSCTLNDACQGGSCVSGAIDPLCCQMDDECDDNNPCTVDSCLNEYCDFAPLDCDDGFDCTSDACVAGACVNTPLGPQPNGPVFTEDFEAGIDSWAISSTNVECTWQLDGSKKHGGDSAVYLGNPDTYTYDYGETVATLSRSVQLPPALDARLEFWANIDVEETGTCNYDWLSVYVNGNLLLPELCSDTFVWIKQSYNITAYAGQTVTLDFIFQTGDAVGNNAAGVWLDDIAINVTGPADCCLDINDCDLSGSGPGCQAIACHPTGGTCMVLPPSLSCDDDDICTVDTCMGDGTCMSTDDPSCCEVPDDCAEHPSGPCAIKLCTPQNTCDWDTSGC